MNWHSVVVPLLYWSAPLRFHFQGSTSPLSKLEVNHYPSLISDFLVKYKLSSIQETTTFKLLLSTPPTPKSTFKIYCLLWGTSDKFTLDHLWEHFSDTSSCCPGKIPVTLPGLELQRGCLDFLTPWWVIRLLQLPFHPPSRGFIEKYFWLLFFRA